MGVKIIGEKHIVGVITCPTMGALWSLGEGWYIFAYPYYRLHQAKFLEQDVQYLTCCLSFRFLIRFYRKRYNTKMDWVKLNTLSNSEFV